MGVHLASHGASPVKAMIRTEERFRMKARTLLTGFFGTGLLAAVALFVLADYGRC
jgi:hypothetical protein